MNTSVQDDFSGLPPMLTDDQLAKALGWPKSRVHQRRYQERGNINAGRPLQDLLPAWIEHPAALRPRATRTPRSELIAWVERNTVGRRGAA